jgi:hypothetical protein
MANPNAQYTFRSWLRRGISTQQELEAGASRASVKFEVAVSNASVPPVKLALYGPGDIKGLDPASVIRVWPKPGARNAEPNYFPLIEFAQPDLPWRFSPQPAAGNRLLPWLALIVLETGSAKFLAPSPTQPLGVINVNASLLPDLNEAWAWAHTQIHGPDAPDDNALAALLAAQPQSVSSRILALTILQPETEYTAYLVPTFEAGRRAGLGLDPTGVAALEPAWGNAGAVSLPVYYLWSFHMGPKGDFASLVRKIHPNPLPETVGVRQMDVSNPGMALPRASNGTLGVLGVLRRHPASTQGTGNPLDAFVQRLAQLLNLPTELLKQNPTRPVVAPPLYGRWQGAQTELGPAAPPWFQELNRDPRHRVEAGAGTLVVQREQQDLLAGAWDQVGEVRAANARARFTELATLVSQRLHLRIFPTGQTDELHAESVLKFTAPVHTRVLGSPVTIHKLIQDSPIARGTLAPQFRRIARPLGPIGRRQGRAAHAGASNLLARMNRGEFDPAPPPPTPQVLATLDRAAPNLVPAWATPERMNWLRRLPGLLGALGLVLLGGGMLLLLLGVLLLVSILGIPLGILALCLGVLTIGLAIATVIVIPFAQRYLRTLDARVALKNGTLTAQQIRDTPIPANFNPTGDEPTAAGVTATATTRASSPAQNFVNATANVFDNLGLPPFQTAAAVPVPLSALNAKLNVALDPRTTVAAAFQTRLHLAAGAFQLNDDPAGQIMAGPKFTQPMYYSLKALSQDWILPNLDQAPTNTAALLVTNQQAVEAFMVGLNHEMSRTLLFNEYPADLRATAFRQFWDSRAASGFAANPEAFRDIREIHQWRNSQLGDNTARQQRASGDDVVLFVRGEVLLRYPDTIVYAAKAQRKPHGHPALVLPDDDADPNTHRFPILTGSLDPDVRFYGFALSIQEALAGDGWFFVLQQHPGEPVFGFNAEPSTRGLIGFKELAWSDVLVNLHVLAAPQTQPFSVKTTSPAIQALVAAQGRGAAQWGSSSAEIAGHTLRYPVRVAYHAREMLP